MLVVDTQREGKDLFIYCFSFSIFVAVIALTQADNCNLARADSTYAFDQLDSMNSLHTPIIWCTISHYSYNLRLNFRSKYTKCDRVIFPQILFMRSWP